MGTTADLSGLKTFLKKVIKGREDQGVIRFGTDEIEKTVFVRAEPTLSLGEVIKVFEAAQQAGASPLKLPVEVKAKKDDESRPPMLLLLITIGNAPEARIGEMSDGIELKDIYEQPADRAEKEMLLEPAIRVKIPRDGKYIVNGKPVGKPASRDELQARLREASGGNPVAVIVDINPQLSYASLAALANAAFDARAAKINLRTIVP
jgi:biopolymer transport protein ExbD